ncbi:hypothetical protein DGo_CA1759 [Deinococcus gobiensis I-0]|uniref:Uncharacterized protein n=1 Tax=Deinococcus gobiensis (strain DSM 21396 / JCM 16679 / CGMCC 1.7299 / I-0) TaxID=745776 RepID=H8GWD6_DEIGI|nr:hypothetical protein DGo_CA1759 [Deinococcus gobiensis I-0]
MLGYGIPHSLVQPFWGCRPGI